MHTRWEAISIPYWFAKCIALFGDVAGSWFPLNSKRLEKIVQSDTISNEKAKRELGWKHYECIREL